MDIFNSFNARTKRLNIFASILKNKGLFAEAKDNFEHSLKLNPDYELTKKELNI